MIPSPPDLTIPQSYTDLPTKDITVSHYPADSPIATPVIIVTLNRPKARNAFTLQMMRDFELCYPLFDVDERVKCIVLTGNPAGKAFCAGADLDIGFDSVSGAGAEGKAKLAESRDTGGRLNLAIYRCRKPTICAMAGSAVGLGMTMTLSAAIRVAHASSKYGFVFARRGITMESNSAFFLPRLIGHSLATYLLTTGDVYRGDSPHFGTLFQEVVPSIADVLPTALKLASTIAEKTSPLANYLNRELMWRGPPSAEEMHLVDSVVLYHMFGGADCKEGVDSFFQKREPKFTMTLEEGAPPNFPWWREVDTGNRTRGKVGGGGGKAKL